MVKKYQGSKLKPRKVRAFQVKLRWFCLRWRTSELERGFIHLSFNAQVQQI